MKFKHLLSILILPFLHSCYLDYNKWYDMGPNEKAWFVKDPKTMTFIDDSTKQIFTFSLTKSIKDYQGIGYHDNVDMEGQYYQFYYDIDTKYSFVLSTNGRDEMVYFWDKTNKSEYELELTMDNSEYISSQKINNVEYTEILHLQTIIPKYSFNNTDAWYNKLRGTPINSSAHSYAYVLSGTSKTDESLLVECWYAKNPGFIKFIIIKDGKTYSFSRVLFPF